MKTDKLLHLITQSAPMREAGRLPLPRAQSGSSVQPYVTTNPNDPRLKAYNDSLNVYNDFVRLNQQMNTKYGSNSDYYVEHTSFPKNPDGSICYNCIKKEAQRKNKTGQFFSDLYNQGFKQLVDPNINPQGTINYLKDNLISDESVGKFDDYSNAKPKQEVILNKPNTQNPSRPKMDKIDNMSMRGFDTSMHTSDLDVQNAKQSGFSKWMGPDGVWHQDYELPDHLQQGSNWRKQVGGTSWFNQQVVQDANARINSVPTTTLGTPLSTPESRSYERRAGYLETHPEKYNTKDYRAGHKEEGLGNDIFSDPIAMAAALTAAGVGTGAVALSSIPRTFGTHLVDQATYGLSNFKNLLNIGKKSDYNGLIDLFNKANIDARNKYNITNFGETAGSAEDLANFKPGSYGSKLATRVYEYNYPMFSPTQNIYFPDIHHMNTGYTDIPSFKKQVQQLKTKINYGKVPMETRMNHIVTSPKDKFDYMHQSILGNNAVDYASPELTEYQFLHPNMSKEFNTKEFNTLFPDKFGARDAYKMPHGIMPNKFGGSTKIRLKRNG